MVGYGLLDARHVASRDRQIVIAVLDEQLHRARFGQDFFHLLQVDKKRTMATHNRAIGFQLFLHLFGRCAQHVGNDLAFMHLHHFHLVAHRLDVEQVGNVNGHRLTGGAGKVDSVAWCCQWLCLFFNFIARE